MTFLSGLKYSLLSSPSVLSVRSVRTCEMYCLSEVHHWEHSPHPLSRLLKTYLLHWSPVWTCSFWQTKWQKLIKKQTNKHTQQRALFKLLCASFVKKYIYKKEKVLTGTKTALKLNDPVVELWHVVVVGKLGEVSLPARYFSTHSTKQQDFVNKVTWLSQYCLFLLRHRFSLFCIIPYMHFCHLLWIWSLSPMMVVLDFFPFKLKPHSSSVSCDLTRIFIHPSIVYRCAGDQTPFKPFILTPQSLEGSTESSTSNPLFTARCWTAQFALLGLCVWR